MTDQTTPEPMADEETLPLAFSDQARRLLAEVDRLRAQLEEARQAAGSEHGRAAAFEAAHREARTRCDARDAEIDRLRAHRDQLHTETRRLGVSLAETIHERQQLRTQLAEAERDRTAALAVAADLTDERDSARAIATGAINDVDRLRARTTAAVLADTEPAYVGPDPAQEPVTATGAPDPDPSEGTAPTGPQEPTQAAVDTIARILVGTDWDEEVPYTDIGPRETVAHLARRIIAAAADLDICDRLRAERDALAAKLAAVRTIEPTLRRIYSASDGAQAERAETTTAPGGAAPGPAPLTLAQAAGHLHDWARDLTDGTNTSYPHGHPSVIRGIRAAADWLDARSAYETEARDARAARPIGLIGDTDG